MINVGNIKHNNHGVQKLNIQLIDESGAIVTILLWGFKTTQFGIKFSTCRKKNVVLVGTGLLAKCNNGHVCLTSTSATKLYFKPSYKQLETLGKIVASKYGEFICQLPSIEAYESLYPIGVQKIYLTLQQIKEPNAWVRPKLMHKQAFFCKVTVKDILSCENWCFEPVPMDDLFQPPEKVYRCDSCRRFFVPVSKSSETIILVADSTATAKLIMKTPELEQPTGLSMMQLVTHCVDNTLLKTRTRYGSLEEVRQCLYIYQDMRKAGYSSNDYYLLQLIEEWREGILQGNNQNQVQHTSSSTTDLGGSQSLLLEKVAANLQKTGSESLAVDLRGLTKVEAQIVVLAVLRMIKENYAPGNSLQDDMSIILGVQEVGSSDAKHDSVKDAIVKLLQDDLGQTLVRK